MRQRPVELRDPATVSDKQRKPTDERVIHDEQLEPVECEDDAVPPPHGGGYGDPLGVVVFLEYTG